MSDFVRDNREKRRYELDVDGAIVYADYRRDGSTIVIPHVETPPQIRGSGAASKLMQGIMAIARAEGLKVRPRCGYVSGWLRRHKEHRDLLA